MNALPIALTAALLSSGAPTAALLSSGVQAGGIVAPEVTTLVAGLRENLDAGERIRDSGTDTAALIRRYPEFWMPGFEGSLADELTDEELLGYAAGWADFALICRSELNARLPITDYRFYRAAPGPPAEAVPPGCGDPRVNLKFIVTKGQMETFLGLADVHAYSLKATARRLSDSDYSTTAAYLNNGDTLTNWLGGPESIERIPEDTGDGIELRKVLDYDEYYVFRLMEFLGYVGLKGSKAKLLLLMPAILIPAIF